MSADIDVVAGPSGAERPECPDWPLNLFEVLRRGARGNDERPRTETRR